nr:cytochrome c biogenesis protein ResB [Geotalea sp. SG265]
MGGIVVLMAIGSFGGGGAESSSINDVALLVWLREVPIAYSWWLWLTIALLAVLAINTILCSIASLRSKYQRGNFLALIAPQVMHAGFLFIVAGHLCSAWGSEKGVMTVREGQAIGFPDGSTLTVDNITGQLGDMGMLTAYQAEVRAGSGTGASPTFISPNHPFFLGDFGIYLKDVQLFPERLALVEIHREPGAGLALAGALLFTMGNVVLMALRRGR